MIAELQVLPRPSGTPDDPHAHVEAAIAVLVALTASTACRGRDRIDTRGAVIPLVPGAHEPPSETARDAGRPRASNAPRTHRAIRYITDRPAPDGALGVRWGMTRAEVAALNTAATISCRDSGEYVFCRRARSAENHVTAARALNASSSS